MSSPAIYLILWITFIYKEECAVFQLNPTNRIEEGFEYVVKNYMNPLQKLTAELPSHDVEMQIEIQDSIENIPTPSPTQKQRRVVQVTNSHIREAAQERKTAATKPIAMPTAALADATLNAASVDVFRSAVLAFTGPNGVSKKPVYVDDLKMAMHELLQRINTKHRNPTTIVTRTNDISRRPVYMNDLKRAIDELANKLNNENPTKKPTTVTMRPYDSTIMPVQIENLKKAVDELVKKINSRNGNPTAITTRDGVVRPAAFPRQPLVLSQIAPPFKDDIAQVYKTGSTPSDYLNDVINLKSKKNNEHIIHEKSKCITAAGAKKVIIKKPKKKRSPIFKIKRKYQKTSTQSTKNITANYTKKSKSKNTSTAVANKPANPAKKPSKTIAISPDNWMSIMSDFKSTLKRLESKQNCSQCTQETFEPNFKYPLADGRRTALSAMSGMEDIMAILTQGVEIDDGGDEADKDILENNAEIVQDKDVMINLNPLKDLISIDNKNILTNAYTTKDKDNLQHRSLKLYSKAIKDGINYFPTLALVGIEVENATNDISHDKRELFDLDTKDSEVSQNFKDIEDSEVATIENEKEDKETNYYIYPIEVEDNGSEADDLTKDVRIMEDKKVKDSENEIEEHFMEQISSAGDMKGEDNENENEDATSAKRIDFDKNKDLMDNADQKVNDALKKYLISVEDVEEENNENEITEEPTGESEDHDANLKSQETGYDINYKDENYVASPAIDPKEKSEGLEKVNDNDTKKYGENIDSREILKHKEVLNYENEETIGDRNATEVKFKYALNDSGKEDARNKIENSDEKESLRQNIRRTARQPRGRLRHLNLI